MRFTAYIFLSQCIIFCDLCVFANAKAMIGQHVRQARHNEFPYVSALIKVHPRQVKLISRFCTGTIITNKDILTADHCVVDEIISEIQVTVGTIDFRSGKRYNPAWWITYNQWAEQTNTPLESKINDIAVIRLTECIPDNIRPAVLSTKTNSQLNDLDVMVAGWGRTSSGDVPLIMETVSLKILSNVECGERMSKIRGKHVFIHIRLICTAKTPFALLTEGDSGDPLLYNNEIVAVSSGTFKDVRLSTERVNVHFRINYYRSFILDITNNF